MASRGVAHAFRTDGDAETIEAEENNMTENQSTTKQPSAPEVFLNSMMAEVCEDDIANIMNTQKYMMSRYEKTNEMLLNFNVLSASRYSAMELDFKNHIQTLVSTRKELEEIFKRIRSLKTKLGRKYPTAFAACVHVHEIAEDEDEEESTAVTTAAADVASGAAAAEASSATASACVGSESTSESTTNDVERTGK